jgi:hypothetical protein
MDSLCYYSAFMSISHTKLSPHAAIPANVPAVKVLVLRQQPASDQSADSACDASR